MLFGKSEGRRGINRHHPGETNSQHENIGRRVSFGRRSRQITETVADYSVFKNKLASPCGFHQIMKRSLGSASFRNISTSFGKINPAKRTVDLVFKLVNIVRDSILGRASKSGWEFPFKNLLKKAATESSEKFDRSRRETVQIDNQLGVKKLEISNLISGIEFLNQAHISQVSRVIFKYFTIFWCTLIMRN
jgi:hypothetical protein